MFMRLVQAKMRPDTLPIIRQIYDEKIIPQLQKMKGCLFACLIRSECQSFSDSSEWKVQLSKDLKLEYQAVPDEPVIKSYAALAHSEEKLPDQMMYLRIVSLKIQPGKMEDFKNIYMKEILPVLRSVKGCRYAYLTTGAENKNEAISITIWDSKEDADAYEQGGIFKELLEKAKPTYSDLYQWKMALERNKSRHMITSDDVSVRYFSVLSVKGFQ